jgi:hypothetical protein
MLLCGCDGHILGLTSGWRNERTSIRWHHDAQGCRHSCIDRIRGCHRHSVCGPQEPGVTPVPAWTQVGDANLAVVGLRIDLERELRRLAANHDLKQGSRIPLRKVAADLADRHIISYRVANNLQDLLTIGNQAAHGQAVIDNSALDFLRSNGLEILDYLQSIE